MGSSLVMVVLALLMVMPEVGVVSEGLLKVTVIPSSDSKVVSPITLTVMVLLVSVGLKLTVPVVPKPLPMV